MPAAKHLLIPVLIDLENAASCNNANKNSEWAAHWNSFVFKRHLCTAKVRLNLKQSVLTKTTVKINNN